MANILVIDDDADIGALVSLKLGRAGHAVVVETDGAVGLDRALTDRPDVVIVDWTLPGLTGPEICARLRESPGERWVILMTGRTLSAADEAGVDADEVIAKPFSPRALDERVSTALQRER